MTKKVAYIAMVILLCVAAISFYFWTYQKEQASVSENISVAQKTTGAIESETQQIEEINPIQQPTSVQNDTKEATYTIGQFVDVTGTVREILADFGSLVGMTEEEVITQYGGLPKASIVVELDGQYTGIGKGEATEKVYSVRINYEACVEEGLQYKDKVHIRGKINSIPLGIGLVLSCDDPSTKVEQAVVSNAETNGGDEFITDYVDDGQYLTFIHDVNTQNSDSHIVADFIVWSNDCDSVECPNGFKIINDNPRLRTLSILNTTSVSLLTNLDGFGFHTVDGHVTPYDVTLPQFGDAIYGANGATLWTQLPFGITVKGGRIISIAERYVP